MHNNTISLLYIDHLPNKKIINYPIVKINFLEIVWLPALSRKCKDIVLIQNKIFRKINV